ncbi:transposase [Streptomyces wuyuanensis]|uniref:transposase n=1 Tax=Streptomyces wuyuanensis TaxID=1196353 RepID=UPI00367DF302
MTAPDSLPLHTLAENNLAAASPDLLRAMVKTFADALMSAEADTLCNAEYGQVSDDRVNQSVLGQSVPSEVFGTPALSMLLPGLTGGCPA